MTHTNCARCGKIFVKTDRSVCNDCLKAEETKFEEVRLFLKEYPNSTLQEVSEACDISPKRIMRYVQDGKIEITPGMKGEHKCAKCGVPINIGRFCEKCIAGLSNRIKEIKPKESVKGRGGQLFMK